MTESYIPDSEKNPALPPQGQGSAPVPKTTSPKNTNEENSSLSSAERILKCESFEELYSILRKEAVIESAGRYVPAEELISIIKKFRKKIFLTDKSALGITRSLNIREVCIRLFNEEKAGGRKNPEEIKPEVPLAPNSEEKPAPKSVEVESDASKALKIKKCENLKQLFAVLNEIGGIQTKNAFLSAKNLKSIITSVRSKIRENPLSKSIYGAVPDVLGLRDKVEELIENEDSPAKPKEVVADTSPKSKPVIDFIRKPVPVSTLKSESITNGVDMDGKIPATSATQIPADKKAVEIQSDSQPEITKPGDVIVGNKKNIKNSKSKTAKGSKVDAGDKNLDLSPTAGVRSKKEKKLKLAPTAGAKASAVNKKLNLNPTATIGTGDRNLDLNPTAEAESAEVERNLKLDPTATAGPGDKNLNLAPTAGAESVVSDRNLDLSSDSGVLGDKGDRELNLASTSGSEPAVDDRSLDLNPTAGTTAGTDDKSLNLASTDEAGSAEVERKLKLDPTATAGTGDKNLDLNPTPGTEPVVVDKKLDLSPTAGIKTDTGDKDLNLIPTSPAEIEPHEGNVPATVAGDENESTDLKKNDLDKIPEDASVPKVVDEEPDISHYEKRRRSLNAVNTDLIETRAQDIASERMTADKESLKGISGYFKKIWKHNWGADYYRAKEIKKIKEELMSAGSTFSEFDTSGAQSREIKESILKRFMMDAPELIHFDAGESIDGVSPEKKAEAESRLQDAIRNYASSSDKAQAELDFKAERDRIYSEIFKDKNGSFNALNVADNVFEFAKEIRGQVENGKALSDLDLDFELTVGNAKTGVRTKEHYSWVDKRVKELSSTWVGRFFNETTIAAGVSAAMVLAKIGTGKGASAAMGLAGGAVLASTIAGVRENQAMKRDRAEHSRAMASGRTFDPSRAPRRAELEASSYNMLNAKTEMDDLHNMLFETVGGLEREKVLSKSEIDTIMARISQIDSRIALSDKGKIDLIGFSDEAMIEVERTNLDLERYRAKIMLKDAFAKDTTLGSFEDKMHTLNRATEDLLVKGQGGIEERDALFNKTKRNHVLRAMATGAGTGIIFGVVGQEIASFWNSQQGFVEGAMGKGGSSGKVTSLEWAREKFAEALGMNRIPQGVETVLPGKETLGTALVAGVAHDVHSTVNSFISLPQGYELNPAGNRAGIYDVFFNGKSVVQNIEIDQSTGNFTANSVASLEKAGFHMNTSVNTLTSSLNSGAVTGGKAVNVQDFVNDNPNKLAQIKRLGWADNGTPMPDSNEVKLWGAVEKDGRYLMAVKMNSSGSVFDGQHIDPVEFAKEGKLKGLISLSHGTQGHPIEVPIDFKNGKMFIDIDPKDPILGQLFHKAPNGEIICDARYVEVGAEMGSKNGVKEFVMCATEEGKGVKTINAGSPKVDDYIRKNVNIKIELPKNPDVVLPPIIPLVPRMPLEPTKGKAPVVSPYYGINNPEQILEEMNKRGVESDSYFVKKIDGKDVWVTRDGKPVERSVERENERIKKYLEEQDVSFVEELKAFERQIGPMNPKCRVAISIPARFEANGLVNLLNQYVKQVDEKGNPIDKDIFEINILVNRRVGENPDRSVEVINDWKSKNPGYHINVVDIEFSPDKANVGMARKYITDLTLLRSKNRSSSQGPLYIESEDADLFGVDKRTVHKLIKGFDEKPELDVLRGVQDRQPEILQKNDLLFFERRLWDFMEVFMRKQAYRPENMKSGGIVWNRGKQINTPEKLEGSSFVWNRVISGGWNTAYTAESYAQIGGYVSDMVGEDMKIGQKISMLRGYDNGKGQFVPNTQTAKSSGLRSSSSPRRFIDSMIKNEDPYSNFDDQSLKSKSIDELIDGIKDTETATLEQINKYESSINSLGGFLGEQMRQPEASYVLKRTLNALGLREGDYEMMPYGRTPAPSNQIKLTDKGMKRIIELLGKYKADNKYKWGYRRQNSAII